MAARALRALPAALGLVVLQLPALAHAQLAAGDLEPLAWRAGTVVRTEQAAVGEDFGGNVALGKDLAVVGAKAARGTGQAHVFLRHGAGFGGEAVLKAGKPRPPDLGGDLYSATAWPRPPIRTTVMGRSMPRNSAVRGSTG